MKPRLTLALLVLAGTVNYFDRSVLSLAEPLIRGELHLDLAAMGLLLSAFAWSYGAAQIPAGILVDRFRPKPVLTAALALWSLAQTLAAACATFPQLLAARIALGLGEAPMYTGGTATIAALYPPAGRATPIAIFNASASLGPAIAPLLLTPLMLALGWRPAFLLLGAMGILVTLAWHRFAAAPATEPQPIVPRLRALLSQPRTLLLSIGFGGVIYMVWLFATWLPGYLTEQRHLSVRAAGYLTAIPLAAGVLGALLPAPLVTILQRRLPPARACAVVTACAMAVCSAATLSGALAHSLPLSLAALSLGVLAANTASSAGWTLGAVLVPQSDVASLEAIQNVGGSIGGALAPALTGILAAHYASFTPPLALAAAIAAATALLYAITIR